MAMFVWHDGWFEVAPWTLVAGPEGAERVAQALEARRRVVLDDEAYRGLGAYIGRLTDLSRALDHAGDLIDAAPFVADRAVVNVIANGRDNMGNGAAPARDRLVAAGATVNGVALDGGPDLVAYFLGEVVGGRAAFVLDAASEAEMSDLMRRKLIADLIVAGR
jgi:hypothetical protein